ncbi:MAG: magnesium transporter [Sulfurovum sp.]|nr:magnesium transporter [Sulfurovum sp.]MCB4745486.1 magnesium transporter [Sulfurovum sp.]MCB4748481.1 magnesium transporter [Sulfurovum sp.]MCB4754474.1 magnesium transporter [Sulfurovum sp.]MCB4764316.1 magnesium transporter [Sulfurovum sp.]
MILRIFIIRKHSMDKLKHYLNIHPQDELHPSEIANLLKDMNESDFGEALKHIPKELIADVALELPDRYFGDIVESFTPQEIAESLSEMESDDQTDFIQELEEHDDSVAKEVFEKLDKEDQKDILQLKQYEEDEAGAYMQVEVYSAKLDQKVEDVIKGFAKLKREGALENINYLFVTDDEDYLRYGVGLDDLIVFDPQKTLREDIWENPEKYKPIIGHDHDDIKEIVQKFQEYDLNSMPIVNEYGKLLGRITSDDIYDIINEHATDQIYHLAGVNDDAEEDDGLLKAGKARAIWLGINLSTAIIASLVIGIFEETLQAYVALAVLMPIVASMGGNAGTQSLTVVVRQLALGEIAKNDAYRTIRKEVILSLVNGFIFALIIGIIAAVWFNKGMLGVVIAMAMIINLLSAGFFGSVIPLLLERFGIDPAIGSTVILTTVTDIVGFFVFLGLATIILL